MGTRILILNGHPDTARKGLCGALADAYADGAVSAGHTVDRLDIGALHFDLLRSQAEFETGRAPPEIAAAQEAIRRADHLVVKFGFGVLAGCAVASLFVWAHDAAHGGIGVDHFL